MQEEQQQSNNKFKPLYEQCVKATKEFVKVVNDIPQNNIELSARTIITLFDVNLYVKLLGDYIKESEEKCQ